MSPAFAQTGLNAQQAQELGEFLALPPAPRAAIELQDPDNPDGRVSVQWNPSANHLTINVRPVTPWDGDRPPGPADR